jgi:hypothetical protein
MKHGSVGVDGDTQGSRIPETAAIADMARDVRSRVRTGTLPLVRTMELATTHDAVDPVDRGSDDRPRATKSDLFSESA